MSREQILKLAEPIYASLVLFVLTVGPVVTLWRDAQRFVPVDAAQSATYVLAQIPALMLLSVRSLRLKRSVSLTLLFVLCAWTLLASIISPYSAFAIPSALKTLLATATGLYLAVSFSNTKQLVIVSASMQIGIVLSYISVMRIWTDSRLGNGQWSGIMINPNFLGPVAVTAVVANVGLMALCWKEVVPRWKLAVILGILGVTFFDVVVLVNTHSANPVLAASMSTVIVASSYIFINRKAQRVQSFALQMVAGVGLITASALALLVYVFNGLVNGPVLPVNVLQSRIYAWQHAWQGGLERPFFGWGDGVAWGDPLFRRLDGWWTVELLAHSHSGYLETLLDSGVLALLLLIAYLVFGCLEATKRGLSDSHSLIIFTFVFLYIYLSIFEPFLVTNYFTWTILVMFLAGRVTHMIGPRTHWSSLVQDRS